MIFNEKDKILKKVEKPTRYTGQELNMCIKDAKSVSVRFGFCFPDVYEIGMSHLGSRIVYVYLFSLVSYCLHTFPHSFLVLMTLILLKSTGRIFCRMFLNWNVSEVFLVTRMGLRVFRRRSGIKCYSYCILSEDYD